MTAFYTVVGFTPAPIHPLPYTSITDGGYAYSGRPRTYTFPRFAKSMATRMKKRSGNAFKVLETIVHESGEVTTNWLE